MLVDAVFIVVTVIVAGLVFFARLLVMGCSMHKWLHSVVQVLKNLLHRAYNLGST